MMNKELQEFLSTYSSIDMEVEDDSEIELELSDFTSLIYSKNENRYYVDTFSDDYEEKLEINIDVNNIQNIECCDYKVTISDIQDFVKLVGKNNE